MSNRDSAALKEAGVDRSPPKFVVTLGRGKTGKSTMLWWLAESALRRRRLRILDADPNNNALVDRFPDVEMPPAVDGEDKRVWLERQLSTMMDEADDDAKRHDMLLDVGANDLLLKRLGAEVQFVDVLQDAGVEPVAIHLLGPDKEDLTYLKDVEESGFLRPKRTVLVLNTGLISATSSADIAFAPIIESDIFQKVISKERGGRYVVMPALHCMREMQKAGLNLFSECFPGTEGGKKLGAFDARRVKRWYEVQMPEMRASIADWLPA